MLNGTVNESLSAFTYVTGTLYLFISSLIRLARLKKSKNVKGFKKYASSSVVCRLGICY